jgi:hypothetical protein
VPIATMIRSQAIGALEVVLAPHLVHLLPRLGHGAVTALLNPEMRRAGDVEIGDGQAASIAHGVSTERKAPPI